jgi:putative membrane-bound dehydrogenase-like protein
MRRRPCAAGFLLATILLMGRAQLGAQEQAFPEPPDTQDTSQQPLTTPQEALASIQLPPGFSATLFASEPDVRQPIAMAWDARGRLWVAENYTYAERETNFDTRLRDRIVILEDTDHDGRADRRTVFWDQAQLLTSIEVGLGGVWALCPPQLLFLPDSDADDRPDGEPVVFLDGWDASAVRHNIANGLRWGPDGWLYGRHGILATSHVGAPGTSPDQRLAINCGIWRVHPVKRTFEVVARGTTNPWGTDWNAQGEMFFSNTVIGHLWHVVPGSHFQRMYGEDFDPHLYELMPQTADHFHWHTAEAWSDVRQGVTPATDEAGGGHAHCGLMIYEGGNWPQQFAGKALMVNLHGRRLNQDRLERAGSGYLARHEADIFQVGDPWFRGIDLTYGPDGGVLILDWSDIGECHENDGVHRSSGRIYKIVYDRPKKPVPGRNLAELTNADLVPLHRHANEWYARQARLELTHRKLQGIDLADAQRALLQLYASDAAEHVRLRALWSLWLTGGIDSTWLSEQLQDENEHVRAWAVRLLTENGAVAPDVQQQLAQRAAQETSGLVLVMLASSLQRLAPADRWPLATRLAQHRELADDPHFVLMVWYGVAAAAGEAPLRAAELAAESKLPRLNRHLSRHIFQSQLPDASDAASRLAGLLAEDQRDAAWSAEVLRGMWLALQGRRRADAPLGWPLVAGRFQNSNDPQMQQMIRELSLVFGDGRAAQELLSIAQGGSDDLQVRRDALRALVTAREDSVRPLLLQLLENRDLSVDAIRGLASWNDRQTSQQLVRSYRRLPAPARGEAIQTLISRPAFAQELLNAVDSGEIPRSDISAFQLRQLRNLGNETINARLLALWPELAQQQEATEERIARFTALLDRGEPGDVGRGRLVFQRACASCHTLFGEGGKVGPELTGTQRGNLRYLLENITDPSAQVAENFRMSILLLVDGRVINGVVVQQSAATVTVQTPTERLTIPAEDIEAQRMSNLSMMPDQLLEPLSAQEVRDLFAFLSLNPPAAEPQP